jgi:transglutaminase-like putative cysteine protease
MKKWILALASILFMSSLSACDAPVPNEPVPMEPTYTLGAREYRYRLYSATPLDLDAMHAFPQSILEVIETRGGGHQLDILVEDPLYDTQKLAELPYARYEYDSEVAAYLEATDLIPLETDNILSVSESLVAEHDKLFSVVTKAAYWCRDNITYDKELALTVYDGYKPEDAIAMGTGTCSEYTNILVALLRQLGVPARYVVGSLYQDSPPFFHLWAEYYHEGYGWIPIEPQTGDIGQPFGRVKLNVGMDASIMREFRTAYTKLIEAEELVSP